MSLNHGPQSLPSFAVAFSSQSLNNMSTANNALPPIHTRLPPMDQHRRVRTPLSRPASEDSIQTNSTSKKRSRADDERQNSDHSASPRLVHIKEEQDQDALAAPSPSPPPPPLPVRSDILHHNGFEGDSNTGAPPPSTLRPSPLKKRRVTISGAPHPLNTDVRLPVDQTNSTPISPVVMGLPPIKRDNPSAIEQVKSMITVKQKQKALIEQRRGSVAGVMSPSTVTTNPPLPATPADKLPQSTRPLRRSPNNPGSSSRRLVTTTHTGNSNPRPPSPSPIIVPSSQPPTSSASNQNINAHTLPPVPISFAKRRAEQLGSGKKKPADILISPREAQTHEQFQPAIQSAPPVPHAGQGSSFHTGRFPMALPRLPAVMGGGDNVRRVATNVPPTPTRLSMQRNTAGTVGVQPATTGISGRSPPAASVPIASTLVPPTPGLFHHPGYSGDKAAFLAPFELFYDALNDSKQLKTWLSEQLQRSNAMMQALTQQQDKLNEIVDGLVQKQVAGMRSDMGNLQRRVEELEDALRMATSGRRNSTDMSAGNATRHHSKGNRTPLRNGITVGPMASESYTFPPVPVPSSSSSYELPPTSRRRPDIPRPPSSPSWGHQADPREKQVIPDTETGSPAPMNIDLVPPRLSVSASRLDVPPPSRSQQQQHDAPPSQARLSPRLPFNVQSPPQVHVASTSSPGLHGGGGKAAAAAERPSLSRQHSSSHGVGPSGDSAQRANSSQSPPLKRAESRRNSVIMSPPEAPTAAGDE